ncbi:MAG TPA: FkbM family methyltransferase [Chitinophagaceae bacterium]
MQHIMTSVVKPGHIAYDIGANNGLHGLLLSRLTSPGGQVFNFEPLPSNVKEITENFELNGLRNYSNVCAAVSDKDGSIYFELGDHDKQGHISSRSDDDKHIKVNTISLDSFIEQGNPGPQFIKMDIEGAESSALRGFERNIEKYFPIMIIELHNPQEDKEVGKLLSFHKYTAYRFDPFKKLALKKISRLDVPHPDPDGIWGSILCLGPNTSINDFRF